MLKSISRTSHEVRGLKYSAFPTWASGMTSHLTRGAWIEIYSQLKSRRLRCSRTSHEVRGLKLTTSRRSQRVITRSHLTRGAWIEMGDGAVISFCEHESHLTRGAWIEIM